MQAGPLGGHHDQKKAAQQEPERKLGRLHDALQPDDDPGQDLGRKQPGDRGEGQDLPDQQQYLQRIVSEIDAGNLDVLADR